MASGRGIRSYFTKAAGPLTDGDSSHSSPAAPSPAAPHAAPSPEAAVKERRARLVIADDEEAADEKGAEEEGKLEADQDLEQKVEKKRERVTAADDANNKNEGIADSDSFPRSKKRGAVPSDPLSFFTPRPIKKNGVSTPKPPSKEGDLEEAGASANKEELSIPAMGSIFPISSGERGPLLFEQWKPGSPAPYLALARTFEEVARISSRLKIREHLTSLFLEIIRTTPEDLLPAVYLSVNKLAPAYHGLELGIGESLIQKAICDATGRTMGSLKAEYDQVGDLGLIAQQSKSNQRLMVTPAPLTIRAVFKRFQEIGRLSGHSSMAHKKGWVQHLLVAARDCEPQFIVRSLQGKLRIGLAEKTVLAALAHASYYARSDKPAEEAAKDAAGLEDATRRLRMVYAELPNYEMVIPALLEGGIQGLAERCHLTAGIPVEPMLAHPTKGIGEVFERLGSRVFTCEYKYDGERAQIHRLENGQTFIYSRNAENNSSKYPDIMATLPEALKEGTVSFILDSEAVAIDAETGALLPFQRLSTRSRKDVTLESIKVPVCLFAFDLLYLNGRSLLKEPLRERRRLLAESFVAIPQRFSFAVSSDCAGELEMQAFLDASIEGQCEGLMVKTLDEAASYEPALRSYNWLKVKKDYLEGVADSLDLVPIGADYGKGKRTGVYGAYLMACYDADTERFQAVTRIGTGFSDAALEQHTEFFQQHLRPTKPSDYFVGDPPDVWFAPAQVWEVRVADLSLSSAYKGAFGIVDPSKGISLRFPRFIRIRDDKKPHHATSSEQLAGLYQSQALVSGAATTSSSTTNQPSLQLSDDEFEF
ncbi:MAG: ATP-dependent DNA ligase [archaeon]|nr:ATP-dependent DNA ligase [archaeon]